ncbi:MAG TPA: hypothetical protein VFF48_05740 [Brevundimonas sp.]|nr:hypothetical protein [Brevundimonas sp.]
MQRFLAGVRWEHARNLNTGLSLAMFGAAICALWWKAFSLPVAALSIIAVFLFLRETYVNRKERYANVMPLLEHVARTVSDAIHCLGKSKAVQSPAKIEEALSLIAQIYSMLTGTRCRAAIKLLARRGAHEFVVFTYARDKASAGAFRLSDESRQREGYDTLDRNPHIKEVTAAAKDGEDYLIFNNLPRSIANGEYQSSSIRYWAENPHMRKQWRGGKDSLPYRSTVMSVIWAEDETALGFLAVDSPHAGVFHDSWDGPLLVSFAWLLARFLGTLHFETQQGDGI